jgi:hypothetical protein
MLMLALADTVLADVEVNVTVAEFKQQCQHRPHALPTPPGFPTARRQVNA